MPKGCSRLRQLSDGTSTSISWHGLPVSLRTICSTSSTPPVQVTSSEKCRISTGHYSFAHALVQHTLYEEMGPDRRARTYWPGAEALESLCGGHPGIRVGELARHWFLAIEPIDVAKALEYSRQAADAALEELVPGDALRLYNQALDLFHRSDDRDPLLLLDLNIGLGHRTASGRGLLLPRRLFFKSPIRQPISVTLTVLLPPHSQTVADSLASSGSHRLRQGCRS